MSLYGRVVAWLVVAGLIGAAVWGIDRRAEIRGKKEVQGAWDAEKLAQTEMTLATEREMRRALDAAAVRTQEEKRNAQTVINQLRSDLRSRTVGLSVAVDSCAAADPGSGNSEARANILPAVADRIVEIIGDADDAVRDLNACVDKYHAVQTASGVRP